MCGLFGFVNYRQHLSQFQVGRIIRALGRASEVRGTDATGVAFIDRSKIIIQSQPMPASKIRFHTPKNIHAVIGHTRMTTQGSEKHNYNNHPFYGRCGGRHFALAHNGVLWNDNVLRNLNGLPDTEIETDSYIAVQLLEQQDALNLTSLKNMAEQIEGSFSFTVLDDKQNLYFVKGDNPLEIWHYEEKGLYLYASTEQILKQAVKRLGMAAKPYTSISIDEGEILCIDRQGGINRSDFAFSRRGCLHDFMPRAYYSAKWHLSERTDELGEVAANMGITQEELHVLYYFGYSKSDIEDLLHTPALLRLHLDEIQFEIDQAWGG